MTAQPLTRFDLPDQLSADRPPEARGLQRDGVRLLVVDGGQVQHARFHQLDRFLRPGDLLVVNTSGTLPAAVDGMRAGGTRVVVHFSTELTGGTWVVELRTAPDAAHPALNGEPGERIRLPGGAALRLLEPVAPTRRTRLWRAAVIVAGDVPGLLARAGRPIGYGYLAGRWPLADYQTVFATHPGSAEMPSAARPFSTELVTRLVAAGVAIAPITLHCGLSSPEWDEPPQPERFQVPAATARLVSATRAGGGRVVAVGTTATRALESAASSGSRSAGGTPGAIGPAAGWTDLVLGPERPPRVVDGVISGLHDPQASHLLLLEAVAGPVAVRRGYEEALRHGYLWHEFGDSTLLLR